MTMRGWLWSHAARPWVETSGLHSTTVTASPGGKRLPLTHTFSPLVRNRYGDTEACALDALLTVTVKGVVTGLLVSSLSLAVQVTVVVPTGKVEPDAGLQPTVGVSPPSSLAVGTE